MSNNPNRSHTKPLSAEDEWAKAAVRSVLDICTLNVAVVEAGLFPSYIQEMKTDAELLQFKQFLEAMRASRRALLRAQHG